MEHIYNFKGINIHIVFNLIKRHYEPKTNSINLALTVNSLGARTVSFF
jgi:hypothetical protein